MSKRAGIVRRYVVGLLIAVLAGVVLLGVEALLVRRHDFLGASDAPDLEGPLGPANGTPLVLAILGDSTAAGVGASRPGASVARLLAAVAAGEGHRVDLQAFGVSGARAADLEPQVDAAIEAHADLAVVLIGANDATHLTRLSSVRRDVGAAVRKLRAAGIRVVVGTCPDMASPAFLRPLRDVVALRGRAVARVETDAVREAGGVPVDIGALTGPAFRRDRSLYSADRFHPGDAGYSLWAHVLRPAVLDVLADFPPGVTAG